MACHLAKQLGGIPVFEADRLIAEQDGRPIPDIFAESGEAYFRQLETNWLRALAGDRSGVVSCGGGMAVAADNRALMKAKGQVVCLTAEPAAILERTAGSDRPLLRGRRSERAVLAMLQEREAAYREAADLVIRTDEKKPEEVAREIKDSLTTAVPASRSPGKKL